VPCLRLELITSPIGAPNDFVRERNDPDNIQFCVQCLSPGNLNSAVSSEFQALLNYAVSIQLQVPHYINAYPE
jgi:hypothetical protein